MQQAQNQECHLHQGQKIIAYCVQLSCRVQNGRCQTCLNQLEKFDCNLAHITFLDDMNKYLKNQKDYLISYLTKLYSNNCWLQEVLQGIVDTNREQLSKNKQFNALILENIEDLKKVNIDKLFENKIKKISSLIEIKNNINFSIDEITLNIKMDQKELSEKSSLLTDFKQMLINLQSLYVQNIIQKTFKNYGDEPLFMNHNLEVILTSRKIINDEIIQQQPRMDSHYRKYPEFNNKQQEVQNLFKEQQNDLALAISLQMMEKYREDYIYQSYIFTQICQICKIDETNMKKYNNIVCEQKTKEDMIHRMLSEYHFDLKNYSQSLQHLQKLKYQHQSYTRGLYFTQMRIAQIYQKLKQIEKLRQQLNLTQAILTKDSYLFFLKAKLLILEKSDRIEIINQFELSISQANTHPMFYRKYIKYLNQVQNRERALQIEQNYRQRRFVINCDHEDENICSQNYLVNLV